MNKANIEIHAASNLDRKGTFKIASNRLLLSGMVFIGMPTWIGQIHGRPDKAAAEVFTPVERGVYPYGVWA